MREYTHVAGALLIYISLGFLINLNLSILCIFLAGWISLFPDVLDRLLGFHRGYGHSIFWLIPFLLIGFLNGSIAFALIIGFTSHIFFDIFTTHGVPILYPLIKTSFVSLNFRNRIKTKTNQDKAVFIFILLLLIPELLFMTGYLSQWISEGENSLLGNDDTSCVPNNHNTKTNLKNNINLNLQLNSNSSKNITVNQVNENDTNVIVENLNSGG